MLLHATVVSRVLACLYLTSLIKFGAAQNPIDFYCPSATTYAPNSTYQASLNTLLAVLSAKADTANGFYNYTSGTDPPDIAYGLFLCGGNVLSGTCLSCVSTAATEVVQGCPKSKLAAVWYKDCMLRYSNETIFSILQEGLSWHIHRTDGNIIGPNGTSKEMIHAAIVETATQASNGGSDKKFSTKEVSISSEQRVFGQAQCTPDLNTEKCKQCLHDAVVRYFNSCYGARECNILYLSCNIKVQIINTDISKNPTNISLPPPSPPPEIPGSPRPGREGRYRKIAVVGVSLSASLSAFLMLTLFSSCIYYHKRKKRTNKEKRESQGVHFLELARGKFGNDYNSENLQSEEHLKSQDFASFQLDVVCAATGNFSPENKLGEGGFGPVYQGILPNGKKIAVKRLSRTSGQGVQELKNEVILIARLQHRNLVRLLGCCLEGNESLLIYEYMSNKSLDFFLFDSMKSLQLDWKRRLHIIHGIARGLLYLHEDSRLRIIHRDLKASNVLLDHEMNPKISDFGMARIFRDNQSASNTNRVVGTYGYMAPEYAMEGLFSVKSDVFSFGVLLLEIISGKKNNGFYLSERGHSLLTFAWSLWSKSRGLELMDPMLVQLCLEDEVLKCTHIGLLCVQDDPANRPTMSSVVHMLANDTMTLPQPTKPTFSIARLVSKATELSSIDKIVSINEVTLSEDWPR